MPVQSSIQSVPPEVLARIFVFCAPATSRSHPREGGRLRCVSDIKQTPWTFGYVCSRWRTISLSATELWTHIYVDISTLVQKGEESAKSLLETYLSRSGSRLLSVHITFDEEMPRTIESALTILLSSSVRWRRLSILLPESALHFFHSITHNFPNLQQFDLQLLDDMEENEITAEEFGSFLDNAPQLQTVSIGDGFNDYLPLFVQMPILPWSQLLDFEIYENADPFNSARYILEACPQVQHMHLPTGSSYECAGAPVVHRHLRSLSLKCRAGQILPPDLFDLLDLLTLPALEVLTLESNGFGSDLNFDNTEHPSALESLITRSSCLRLRLRVESAFISDVTSFLLFLEMTPSLQSLEFRPSTPYTMASHPDGFIIDDFVDRMRYIPQADQLCLLPNLRTLLLEDAHYFEDDDAFASMVESRWRLPGQGHSQAVVRIEEVSLVLDREMDAAALKRLKEMREEGLDVRVWTRMSMDAKVRTGDEEYLIYTPGLPSLDLVPVLPSA